MTLPDTGSVTPNPPPRSSSVTKAIKYSNHPFPSVRYTCKFFVLADELVGALAGFHQQAPAESWEVCFSVTMFVSELCLTSGFDPKPHHIEGSHDDCPLLLSTARKHHYGSAAMSLRYSSSVKARII